VRNCKAKTAIAGTGRATEGSNRRQVKSWRDWDVRTECVRVSREQISRAPCGELFVMFPVGSPNCPEPLATDMLPYKSLFLHKRWYSAVICSACRLHNAGTCFAYSSAPKMKVDMFVWGINHLTFTTLYSVTPWKRELSMTKSVKTSNPTNFWLSSSLTCFLQIYADCRLTSLNFWRNFVTDQFSEFEASSSCIRLMTCHNYELSVPHVGECSTS
jgi:hypothetical protein